MAADNRAAATGLICALLSALGFSFKAIFVKSAYRYGVDAETLLAMRMLYALPCFIVMAIYAAQRTRRPLDARDWRELLLLGFFGYYASSYLDFLGLRYITAALERVVLYTYPAMVVMMMAWQRRQPPSRAVLMALALSYAGVALAVLHDVGLGGQQLALGVALVFGSAGCFALYMVRCAASVQRIGTLRVTAWATGFACIMSALQFVLMRAPQSLPAQPWQVQLCALAMAIFSTVLPIWLGTVALRRLGADRVAIVSSLGPVLTLLLAWLVLGETLSATMLAGAALVMLGVRLIVRKAADPEVRGPTHQPSSHS